MDACTHNRSWIPHRKWEERVTKPDSQQIQELMARYANAIDSKDYTAIGFCFTEDATASYSDFSGPLNGRAAILAHMRKALGPLTSTQHIFGNFIIDTEGEEGRATCAILAQHLGAGGTAGKTYLSGGQYSLTLRRIGDDWQIANASAREVWSMGDRALLPQTG